MRIMMLNRFRCNGVTNHLLSLAAELCRQDFKVVVVLTDCPPAYLNPLRRYHRFFPCFAENSPEEILRLARHYRIDLLHLHDLSLFSTADRLLRSRPVPCGVTWHDLAAPADNLVLLPLSFLITAHPQAGAIPPSLSGRTFFIPEGIALPEQRLTEKKGSRVAVVLEEGFFDSEGAAALLKAAALSDVEVELLCPQPLPLLKGRNHGWPLERSAVLAKTGIVIGRHRCLLEGMACGNAALIAGRGYGGLFEPQKSPSPLFPDLSGRGEEPLCYRSVFFDLAALLEDRSLLQSLQLQSRQFVRENCDLRLIAEKTGRLYREAAG